MKIIVYLCCIIGAAQIKRTHASTKDKYLRSRMLATNVCPTYCHTENCGASVCAGCEFACGGTCTYAEEWMTNAPPKPSDPPSTVCPITTFEDITSQKFADDFWHNYPEHGRPTQPESAPVFVDLNSDGVLDFHTMSHHRALAESVKVDCNGGETGNCYKLENVRSRIHMTNKQSDSHGSTIMDIDGDGIPDLLVSVGGGLGGVNVKDPLVTENTLLWGDLDASGNIVFKGGRDAARAAGVSMRLSRGRFSFILDANGDGLLDIFFATDRPKVDALTPGYLFINQGNRTFRKDDMVSEYSTAMLITDVDGDGFANEFVITRDLCYPQTKGPYSDENMEYCKTRPLGTTAVYKFNPNTNQMDDVGKHYYSNSTPTKENQPPCCAPGTIGTFIPDNKNCYVRSTASADFDGDLLADQIFLYSSKLVFYFSSDRPVGTLPFGGQYIGAEIYLPLHCTGKLLRIVDLDNDGKEEIIVGCFEAATFLVYTQGTTKSDWTLENGCNSGHALGDINDLALAAPNQDDYETACKSNHRFAGELCNNYNKKGENDSLEDLAHQCIYKVQGTCLLTNVNLAGLSVVDLENDGFLDLVVANRNGHLRFFRNKPSQGNQENRFIAIKLAGKGVGAGNVYGIGATVILYSKDCEGCEEQMREVSSYQHATDQWGYQDERIYFGLGAKGKPIKAVVRWPNGSVQTKELCSWEFSSFVVPVTIEQCDKDSDQCGDSQMPCEEATEACEDSDSTFNCLPENPLGCWYVTNRPDSRAFRCSRMTTSGKPVSDFCRKSCGVCK